MWFLILSFISSIHVNIVKIQENSFCLENYLVSFKSAEREKLPESLSELLCYCPVIGGYLGRPLVLLKLSLPKIHTCLIYVVNFKYYLTFFCK